MSCSWTTARSSTCQRSISSSWSWMELRASCGVQQQEGTEPVTQDLFREWMHIHSCKLKWEVADMAFFTPSWMTFWKTHGVKTMPTGRATPWPNRAETAVRLFKRQHEKLLMDASVDPALNKVTLKDLELMKPDQLSAVDLPRDATLNELRKLVLRAHLEARQSTRSGPTSPSF